MQLPKLEKVLDKIDRIQNVQYTKQTIMQRTTRKFYGQKIPESEEDSQPEVQGDYRDNHMKLIFD